jgi:hypothetical protein
MISTNKYVKIISPKIACKWKVIHAYKTYLNKNSFIAANTDEEYNYATYHSANHYIELLDSLDN